MKHQRSAIDGCPDIGMLARFESTARPLIDLELHLEFDLDPGRQPMRAA